MRALATCATYTCMACMYALSAQQDTILDCNLQIYSVDFASSNGGQLQRVGGSVKVSESFERITWGAIGLNPASYPVHPHNHANPC